MRTQPFKTLSAVAGAALVVSVFFVIKVVPLHHYPFYKNRNCHRKWAEMAADTILEVEDRLSWENEARQVLIYAQDR